MLDSIFSCNVVGCMQLPKSFRKKLATPTGDLCRAGSVDAARLGIGLRAIASPIKRCKEHWRRHQYPSKLLSSKAQPKAPKYGPYWNSDEAACKHVIMIPIPVKEAPGTCQRAYEILSTGLLPRGFLQNLIT